MHTLAFATQKGGVGKTTTLIGTAETLSETGKDVLVVDVDAQCNASRWLIQKGPHEYDPRDTILHAADPDAPTSGGDAITETRFGVDLIPAHPRMNAMLERLDDPYFLEDVLEDAHRSSLTEYDFVLIDTPPYIGASVWAAMAVSDGIIVPIQLEGLAFEGLISLMDAVEHARGQFNDDLEIVGIFANQVDVRRGSAKEGWDFLQTEYSDLIFDSRLRQRASVAHASTSKRSIRETSGDHVLGAFDGLIDEITQRLT